MEICGDSSLKSGEVSSSLARTWASVFDAKVVVERVAVAGVGGQPKRTRQGVAVVAERQLQAVDGRAAMVAVGVVELGVADAHLHVGHAHMVAAAIGQRAILRADGDRAWHR